MKNSAASSLDSGPIYSLRLRPFAIPVFTKDREMALYPRDTRENETSGYRDQWDIAKDDIATSKKVQ